MRDTTFRFFYIFTFLDNCAASCYSIVSNKRSFIWLFTNKKIKWIFCDYHKKIFQTSQTNKVNNYFLSIYIIIYTYRKPKKIGILYGIICTHLIKTIYI